MKKLFFMLLFPILGSLGSTFVASSIDTWYIFLQKPTFTPPNFIFGPVWIFLYIIMGYYYSKLLELPSEKYKNNILTVFYIQFILNILWTPVFFGLNSIISGAILISLLFIAVLFLLLYSFNRIRIPTILMFPYLLWLTFASILNWSIFILN